MKVEKPAASLRKHIVEALITCLLAASLLFFCLLSSCTFSITLVDTDGKSSHVVDQTATESPYIPVTPTVSFPQKGVVP